LLGVSVRERALGVAFVGFVITDVPSGVNNPKG
jgi:hypothetical protein